MKRVLVLATLLLVTAFAFAQSGYDQSSPTAQSSSQAQNGAASGDEQQLRDIEQQWAEAQKSGDAATIARIEADNYAFTGPDGMTSNKQQDVEGLKSGQVKYQQSDLSDLKANVNGDTATVTGRITIKGTDHGKDISGTYDFTDTFVKKDGTWQAVSTKSTKADNAMKQ